MPDEFARSRSTRRPPDLVRPGRNKDAGDHEPPATQRHDAVDSQLLADLFAASAQEQRTRMLACLLRPLNMLSLAGVAAGAFVDYLTRRPRADDPHDLDRVSRYSREQISALSDFVDQIDHEAVVQAMSAAEPGRGVDPRRSSAPR